MQLSNTLSAFGHEVTNAENRKKGLRSALADNNGLVITDINIKEMDGLALLRNLRQPLDYYLKPIFILTSESSMEMKMQGKEAGATGWLFKPVEQDKLSAIVSSVLE